MERRHQVDWTLPAFGEHCPSPIDWARLAAFIDGEGSVIINTNARKSLNSGHFSLRVTVANTDVRLMIWLKDAFGGTYKDANTDKYYAGKNWKRAYHWGASAHRGAWILHNCMPYFVMKREQAEIGLRLQESMRKFTRGPGKSLPFDLVQERVELKRQLLKLKRKGVRPLEELAVGEVTEQ